VGLLRYLGSIFATLLPPRYRPNALSSRDAYLCGMVQGVGMLVLLATRLVLFSREPDIFQQSGLSPDIIYEGANRIGEQASYGSGIFLMLNFILRPVNMLILYLSLEGLIRTFAAMSDQVIGSLPLYAISGIHGLVDKARYKKHVGPLVVDQVIPSHGKHKYDLKVYSCRAKLRWNPYMTIEYEGQYYQYFREEHGPPPRRFVYYLRKYPVGVPAVVIDHYRIEKVLEPEPEKWAGTPGVWDKLLPNWKLPPLAPDEVVRGGPRSHYDLKIYSCRPKDWNTYITIEFEEQWYHLRKDERGPNPRPYIYYLKKAHETRPVVVIKKYKIDDVLKGAEKSGPGGEKSKSD